MRIGGLDPSFSSSGLSRRERGGPFLVRAVNVRSDGQVRLVFSLQKRPFERSDGELPSSFEQRVHVMLHRIGVTKVLSSEGKKKPVRDGDMALGVGL